MTYSDSLHRIKRNTNPTFWNAEDIEHYNNIVNAIEKQIPKKPIEKDWVAFDVLQERDWFCPDCDENMLSYGQPYCSVCGQAIDWE
jgi:hypothetical protein